MPFPLLVFVLSETASAFLPAAICSAVLHMHHSRMKASAPAEISSESEDLLIL